MKSKLPEARPPFARAEIAAVFRRHPPAIQKALLKLRELIFKTAAATGGVGELSECLKWGQASYLTGQTKSGTTVRIGYIEADEISPAGACGIYVHCQTNLVAGFRRRQKERAASGTAESPFIFEGNRCVRVSLRGRLPTEELREIFMLAFTYHLRNKRDRKA
ncbi:MAG: DUF1801 domain-containing protein [bacterium]|nr:DUF1801 domain-containing protein [bacterium]